MTDTGHLISGQDAAQLPVGAIVRWHRDRTPGGYRMHAPVAGWTPPLGGGTARQYELIFNPADPTIALSPALLRERMATSGCYGDGVTPADPCDCSPADCAGAKARALTDDQLRTATRTVLDDEPHALPESVDPLAWDIVQTAHDHASAVTA